MNLDPIIVELPCCPSITKELMEEKSKREALEKIVVAKMAIVNNTVVDGLLLIIYYIGILSILNTSFTFKYYVIFRESLFFI